MIPRSKMIATVFSGKSKLDQLLYLFRGAGDDVGIEHIDATASDYYLLQHLGSGYYWAIKMVNKTAPDGAVLHSLDNTQIRRLVTIYDQEDASIAYNGAGWTGALAATGLTYGNTYRRTATTNDYVRFTTPAGTSRVGMINYVGASAGLCKVVIDGDATLATSLMTAQQYVDAGTFPNTILVANGGTLNPTDRVKDQYENVADGSVSKIELADGLSAGVHTVDVYCTGYKRAASSDVRLYISAFWVNPASGTTLATSGSGTTLAQALQPINSVWEYAIPFLSGAATDQSYNGNGHGYDHEQTYVINVNGVEVTPGVFSISGGSLVEITRTSLLRHPDLGATNCANVSVSYTMHPTTGLTVNYSLTWLVNGTIPISAYTVMMPFDDILDTGNALGAGVDINLLNDNGSENASGKYRAYYAWDADGLYALLVDFTPSLSVNGWDHLGARAFLEDRVDSNLNKVYAVRCNANAPFSINDVWQSLANYRCQKFINANTVLANRN